LLGPGTFYEHDLPVFGTHVIQVDIDGKPRDVEDKKIQGGSTFEDKFTFKERMALKGVEKIQQMNDFLKYRSVARLRFS